MPQISISNKLAYNALYMSFVQRDATAYIQYSGNEYYNLGDSPEVVAYNYGGYAAYLGSIPVYQYLRLMKGTVPTDFSGLTGLSSRSSDVLVQWETKDQTGWLNDGVKTFWMTGTDLVYATTGGTATWLWWLSAHSNSATVHHQAVFTVGTLGSGSDFELLNTTVISGNGYRLVNGPRVTMGTEWNY